jgi:predicted amidohydrolase
MKVTVCELSNDPEGLKRDWQRLLAHVKRERSELVLLPEMPFYPWMARSREFTPSLWKLAVKAHEDWMQQFIEMVPAMVLATVPVIRDGRRLNEGFLWHPDTGYRPVHTKYYLPDEAGFWEATWYERGPFEFLATGTERARIGFLICTEMWFTEHARAYAVQGVDILACPRATPGSSVQKWIAGGRTAAVTSGAFCLSSNFGGTDRLGMHWGGKGWIIEPEEGDVLALTSPSQPIVTLDIDLGVAVRAKSTYPRYVRE